LEYKSTNLGIDIKEILNMIKKKAKGLYFILMEIHMLVILKTIKNRVQELFLIHKQKGL